MKSDSQRRLEHNMLQKFSYVAKHKNSMHFIETDHGTIIDSGVQCDMFNIIAGINVSKLNELTNLFNHFKQHALPFALWTGFSTEDEITQDILSRVTLPTVEIEVGMCANTNNIKNLKINPSLAIEQAGSDKHIKDIVTVLSELLPEDKNAIHRYFNEASDVLISPSSNLTFYVGYLNNKPIATSSLYRDEVAAGVWDIITLPEARRQGIGTTMTYSTAMQAKKEGYDLVVLTASAEGLSVYEKMGFTELNTYKVFNFSQ